MRTATLALLGLLLGARGASADVIHVPADQPTIQAGIDAAVDGDEVVIAPGTYEEVIDFVGKAITVRGSGRDLTIIDGSELPSFPPVVTAESEEGADSILRDLTVTGGHGLASGLAGGIVISTNSNLTLMNCHITGNSTCCAPVGIGGGLTQFSEQTMLVVNCVFSNNSAGASEISSGTAIGGGASVSNAIFINCTFVDNQASGHSLMGNQGSAYGGGLAATNALLINCLIQGNSASGAESARGGGVASDFASANIELINCTVVNNVAIAGNSKVQSGGVYGAALANCIVVGNSGTDLIDAIAHHSCIQGGFPGEGNIDADPLFIDPDNGDFRLQDGSPCRDAGSNDALPPDTHDLDGDGNTSEQVSRDLDLLRRKVNGIVDMGAYEWQHDCASDIAPSSPGVAGDGVVDVDDLVAVILGWGASDQCVADIDGDDVVDVDDLVLVVLGWGPCR